MPKNIVYRPIFDLISNPRLTGFTIFLDGKTPVEDYEQYGVYIWSQRVAAAIYPLIQHLEVLLRNSIDREARARFGDYWWGTIPVDQSRPNWNNFKNGIAIAERNLMSDWKKRERARLGIAPTDQLPLGTILPAFSHDDIIAATDFGTWKEILVNAYHTSNPVNANDYLWPKSMNKVFRRYNLFNQSPDIARSEILNAVNELKDYRNRLFHHDCIWVKSRSTDAQTAIDSIRHKINLIEKLITSISPATFNALNTWGVISHSKERCSKDSLKAHLEPL